MLKALVATLVIAVAFAPLGGAESAEPVDEVPYAVAPFAFMVYALAWEDIRLLQDTGSADYTKLESDEELNLFRIDCLTLVACTGLIVEA